MNDRSRPLPYSILSHERIHSLPVRDRLQLMQDLWNSIFFGTRKARELWFPLGDAILHEFERRWPHDIEIVEVPEAGPATE